jgi:hypothetical protein
MTRSSHRTARRFGLLLVLAFAVAAVVVPAGQARPDVGGGAPADASLLAPDDRDARIVPSTGFPAPSVLPDDRIVRFTPGTGETTPVTPPDDRPVRFSPAGEPSSGVVADVRGGFDWGDAWLGALAGFAAALLLGLALVTTLRMREGRMAHA